MALLQKDKFYRYNLYAFLFFIVIFHFHRVSASIPLIFLSIFFIIDQLFFKKSIVSLFKNNIFLLLTSLYFIFCSFTFFQDDSFQSFMSKEKLKLLFVLIPLIIFNSKSLINKHWNRIMLTSVYSALAAIIFFLVVATINFFKIGINAYFYNNLVSITFINPIVYSIVININIVLAFFYLKNDKIKLLSIVLMSLFVLMLLSKIGILILILILSSFLIIILKKNFKQGLKLLGIIGLGIVIFAPIFLNSELVQRRINVFNYYKENNNSENLEKQFPRKIIFSSAVGIIKENFVVGVGVSNTKKELKKEFEKIGFKKGLEYNYDAHNQYLETFLGMGIIGFIVFIAMMFYLYYKAVQQQKWILLYLSLIFSIVFLVECFLESQMGVSAFLLYSSLFLVKDSKH